MPEFAGANVLRGCLLRVLLLNHRPPHGQALQPAAGGDVRAGPPERERLPLPLRAGEGEKKRGRIEGPEQGSETERRTNTRKDEMRNPFDSAL